MMVTGKNYISGVDIGRRVASLPLNAGAGYLTGLQIGNGLGFDEQSQRRLGTMSAVNAGLLSTGSLLNTLRRRSEVNRRMAEARANDYVALPNDRYAYDPYSQSQREGDFFKRGGHVRRKSYYEEGGEVVFDASPDAPTEVFDATPTPPPEPSFRKPLGFPTQVPETYQNPNAPKGGTVAVSHNNPGNIKMGKYAQQFGATPGRRATDGGVFAVFPDVETGLKAQRQLLQGKNYRGLTVNQAMRRWSNNGYGGEIFPAISTKTMSDLTDGELRELQRRQIQREDNNMYKLIYDA